MSTEQALTNTPIIEREPASLAPHMDQNRMLVNRAMQREQDNFLVRLFPNESERHVRQHELEQLQAGFDYRRRALHLAVETKLQAIEESCNHVLVTGKAEIRRQRQEFFAEEKLKLQQSMNQTIDRFHGEMERRFDALAKLRHEVLREREEQRLLQAVDRFHAMLDDLEDGFVSIIHEGVSSRG
ncbi:MAG: hypothetical protein N838_24570 [Thiohalocapsa sp. PB-PSB1]|jgi:hypothetical protein|nr:MAG: hypothetical protein N838_33655 [Thiohalocapsa sp. PB-PSB1]QQO56053.1 MAG: hypothetical protein N838_24570 [Thiohalocapsa sp. PB-PSB1]